ncbi:MAG: sensor histidine kinase N-terminal domain-containing protein [Pseudomonadota bacterium]
MTTRREPLLKRKLLAVLLGPLLVLLLLDSGFSWWTSWKFATLAHDRSLHEIARELVLHVHGDRGRVVLELSPAAERLLLQDPEDKLFFRVTTRSGQMLGGETDFPLPGNGNARINGEARFYPTQVRQHEVRAVAAWLPWEGAAPGDEVLVQVAETLRQRTALAHDILLMTLLPQLLLVLLASAAVYIGVASGLKPLERLKAAVSARSHTHLGPLDTAGVPGEVRPIVEEVNDLMSRLGQSLESRDRFIADAAHQLKTPVSGLKAQIELALRESDPERLKHSLAQLYISTERLARLVRQLLELARNEPGAATVQLEPLDLRALALSTSMEWVPQALRAGVDLGFDSVEIPMRVLGEPERLRELVNNLIDNAIRYSARGGRVTVSTWLEGAHVCLAVGDDSTRIPQAERARIFERFHRILGTHADGSGLGLAIVSEIASLHGACIRLEDDTDGVGNRFILDFPRA